jgi:hypothetical protein
MQLSQPRFGSDRDDIGTASVISQEELAPMLFDLASE